MPQEPSPESPPRRLRTSWRLLSPEEAEEQRRRLYEGFERNYGMILENVEADLLATLINEITYDTNSYRSSLNTAQKPVNRNNRETHE